METIDTPPLTEQEWERVRNIYYYEWRRFRQLGFANTVAIRKCLFDK
jgi:hypothetical protein